MSSFRKTLCWIYAAIAVVALVATWSQNIAQMRAGGGAMGYLDALKVTAASRSFAVDIGLFLLSATFLMVIEARRLKVRFVWAYVVLGFLIAISVTFPLFLIARELRLAKGDPAGEVKLTASDWIGLGLTAALTATFSWYILT